MNDLLQWIFNIDLFLQKIYWVTQCSIKCHYAKRVWNGVSGKMEEQHSDWAVERGGTWNILVDRCEIEFQVQEERSIEISGPTGYSSFSLGFTLRLQPAKMLPSLMLPWFWATIACSRWRMAHFLDLTSPQNSLSSKLPLDQFWYPLSTALSCVEAREAQRTALIPQQPGTMLMFLIQVHPMTIRMSLVQAGVWHHLDIHRKCFHREP